MSKNCTECGKEIPEARLKALPDTDTCVDCSTVKKVGGRMNWEGKHTPVLMICDDPETAVRGTRRGFHAQIGVNSYNNPRLIKSVQANPPNLSQELKEPPVEGEVLLRNKARCHPDRPRINPRGDCFECAVAWYKNRRK